MIYSSVVALDLLQDRVEHTVKHSQRLLAIHLLRGLLKNSKSSANRCAIWRQFFELAAAAEVLKHVTLFPVHDTVRHSFDFSHGFIFFLVRSESCDRLLQLELVSLDNCLLLRHDDRLGQAYRMRLLLVVRLERGESACL